MHTPSSKALPNKVFEYLNKCVIFIFHFFLCYYSRMPQLFTKDIALVQQFFESMCKVCLEDVLYIKYPVITE